MCSNFDNYTIGFRRYKYEEMDDSLKSLADRAKAAAEGAYAPYSGFRVGAAALLDDGSIVTGANQESVSFPAGLCAERTLLFSVMNAYPGRVVKSMAVVAVKDGEMKNVSPCGICRQTLADVSARQGKPIEVIFHMGGEYISIPADRLMPFSFPGI